MHIFKLIATIPAIMQGLLILNLLDLQPDKIPAMWAVTGVAFVHMLAHTGSALFVHALWMRRRKELHAWLIVVGVGAAMLVIMHIMTASLLLKMPMSDHDRVTVLNGILAVSLAIIGAVLSIYMVGAMLLRNNHASTASMTSAQMTPLITAFYFAPLILCGVADVSLVNGFLLVAIGVHALTFLTLVVLATMLDHAFRQRIA